MNKLFFDISISGHHTEYISHIVDFILESNKEENYFFVVNHEFSDFCNEIIEKSISKKNITWIFIEKQWTKRDAFILLECDNEEYSCSKQILSGFILMKKCPETSSFMENFLKYSLDHRILSDNDNELQLPNYPEFITHRHDQSVLSLLSKKSNIVLIEWDLSDYGVFPNKYLHKKEYLFDETILDTKKNIFRGTVLCNREAHPLKYAFKYYIKCFLFNLGFKI